ncbi:MAG: DUF4232 domain-containing protein [Cellulomonas sp.]
MPGLVVMVAAGVRAQPYTPDWFDVSETCLHRDPCFSEQESAAVLRSSAWLGWAGLLMVLVGLGLCAWALSTRRRSTPSGRGAAVHAAVSGLVAAPAAALGLLVAWFGTFMGPGLVIVVIAWLALAAVVEALSRSLGRARGDRAAYLLSLASALVGLVAMAGTLAFLGWGGAQLIGALALSGLLVAAVTALGDVAQDRHLPSWTPWAAAAVTGVAILGAALGGLGLLEPPTAWASGTWSAVGADVPAPVATAPSPRAPGALPSPSPTPLPDPTPTPTPTPTSVDARRPCSPGDLTLAVGEFDFAMGARAASIRASNRSESACYLDGFATVRLLQGGKPLDLTVATTPSENPGQDVDGQATRVGIDPGQAARLVLYWRGYSQAADTMTPQTLEVSLEPGVAAVPLEVPEPRFDLVDGGEIRVGNWLPSTS